jgi:hypothetical protein
MPNDKERGLENRGTTPPKPRQPAKCKQRSIAVTDDYADFEALVENWISKCVSSRTNNIHRERPLVRGNKSLKAVWLAGSGKRPVDEGKSKPKTRTVLVDAHYQWFRTSEHPFWGVEEILFTTTDAPIPHIPQDGFMDEAPELVTAAAPDTSSKAHASTLLGRLDSWKRMELDLQAEPAWVERIDCVLKRLKRLGTDFDDRYVRGEDLSKITSEMPASSSDFAKMGFMSRVSSNILTIFFRRIDNVEPPDPNMTVDQKVQQLLEDPDGTRSANKQIADDLKTLDAAILRGTRRIQEGKNMGGTGYNTVWNWIADGLKDSSSLYYCYKNMFQQ